MKIPIKGESSSSSGSLFVRSISKFDLEAVYRGEHASPEENCSGFRQKYPDVSFGISDVQLGALAATFDPSLFDNASVVAKPETYDEKRKRFQRTSLCFQINSLLKGRRFSAIHRDG